MNLINPQYLFQEQPATQEKGAQGAINYKSFNQTRMQAKQTENQDVTLTTEEGDRVTISLMSQMQANYMSFDYSAGLKGKTMSMEMEKFQLQTRDAFAISVEGDLNAEELADIEKVMNRLNGIMGDLVSGNMEGIMEEALAVLDGTETISGLEALLQVRQQVIVEQRTMTRMTGPGNGIGNGRGNGIGHGRGNGLGNGQGNLIDLADVAAKISNDMMELMENSKVAVSEFEEQLKQLLAGAFDQIDPNDPDAPVRNKLVEQLQADLLEKMTPKNTPVGSQAAPGIDDGMNEAQRVEPESVNV